MSDPDQHAPFPRANAMNLRCPVCESGDLAIRQCRAVCDNCGYVESCEDNFVPNQDNPATDVATGP